MSPSPVWRFALATLTSVTDVLAPRNLALRLADSPYGLFVHPHAAQLEIYIQLAEVGYVELIESPFDGMLCYRTTPVGRLMLDSIRELNLADEISSFAPAIPAFIAASV